MIAIDVIEQNAARVVLQGSVTDHPELTFTSTVYTDAIAADPLLLSSRRDWMYVRLMTDLDNWTAAQAAIAGLR